MQGNLDDHNIKCMSQRYGGGCTVSAVLVPAASLPRFQIPEVGENPHTLYIHTHDHMGRYERGSKYAPAAAKRVRV